MRAYTRVDNAAMSISNRLNEAMQRGDGRPKMSQTELSVLSAVPQPTIARILKGGGKKGPETDTLEKLAHALGIEFMWLLQGVGPKYPGGRKPEAAPEKQRTSDSVAVVPRFLRYWLSDEESEILAKYRSMTEDGRRLSRIFINRQKRDDSADAADKS